jgi:cytosine/adenosine deaminase-related metal-dependent hydrolase
MTILNALGLKPPGPPRATYFGGFELGDVTVVNPGFGRQSQCRVRIANGTIESIGPLTTPFEGSTEFADCTVLPGLVDMHVHLPPRNALPLTEHAATMYLAHGVTTVREAGDLDGTAVDAARKLRQGGLFPCPDVVSCGPFVGAGRPTFRNTHTLKDASPEEAEAAALSVKATGAAFMKFYDGLSEPMIRALEAACARHGLEIMGHVPSPLSFETARIREVQHYFGVPPTQSLERDALVNRSCDWHAVDERRMDDIVAFSLRENIANTPTIVTNSAMLNYLDFPAAARQTSVRLMPSFYPDLIWHPEHGGLNSRLPVEYIRRQVTPAIRKKQQLTKRLIDAGASLFLGTDVGQPFVLPGLSLQQEMHLFAEAGIAPEQVWRLTTRNAGERLGIPQLGVIEAGAPADILLFREDPTASLRNLDSLIAVVCGGRLYRKSELDRTLSAFSSYFRSPIIRPLAARGARQAMTKALRRSI